MIGWCEKEGDVFLVNIIHPDGLVHIVRLFTVYVCHDFLILWYSAQRMCLLTNLTNEIA